MTGVVWIIAFVIHRISLELFAPDQPLYDIAAGATNLNGAARADLWFQILSIWMPLIAVMGIFSWAIIREYKRQVSSSVQRV